MTSLPTDERMPPDWVSFSRACEWITNRLAVFGSRFILDNWDCKYIDARIDMRTGAVLLRPGNVPGGTSAPGPSSGGETTGVYLPCDCRTPNEMQACPKKCQALRPKQHDVRREPVTRNTRPCRVDGCQNDALTDFETCSQHSPPAHTR